MGKGRLEAFSDGVLAIIITIMVLELKVPTTEDASLNSLKPLLPKLFSYVLSFIYVGIYWNNHHHLLQASKEVNGKVLWANMHLLFWLSLIPFASAWMGEHQFAAWPLAVYGTVLLMCGIAYYILAQFLIRVNGKDSTLAKAIGKDKKGIISVILYPIGILLGFWNSIAGFAIYIVVAAIWFVPDRRIEENIEHNPDA